MKKDEKAMARALLKCGATLCRGQMGTPGLGILEFYLLAVIYRLVVELDNYARRNGHDYNWYVSHLIHFLRDMRYENVDKSLQKA